MKPYHIVSEFYKAWVDLESIQAIYDVVTLPDQYWQNNGIAPAMFSIQFAFQDRVKQVHTWKGVTYGSDQEKTEAEKAIVRGEIAELRRMHDELVQAWLTCNS